MTLLQILLLPFFIFSVNCSCPEETKLYVPPNYTPGEGFCYIVLKFEEIKFIRDRLWKDPDTKRTGWTGSKYEQSTVDSKADAIRMCALVPEIDKKKFEWIEYKIFKEGWPKVPDMDVGEITLPTPQTKNHLDWLKDNIMIDDYKKDPKKYNKGRLWLDITKSNSNLTAVPNNQQRDELKQKPGDCGYLYKDLDNSPQASGLYWVQCIDDWNNPIEKENDMGSHMVACQLMEVQDCRSLLNNTACVLTSDKKCHLTGQYEPLTKPHKLGEACPENNTLETHVPCQKKYRDQCKRDCIMEPWMNETNCLQEIEGEPDVFFECIKGDGMGIQFQTRRDDEEALFGGILCANMTRERKYPCLCKGSKIGSKMWNSILMIILGWWIWRL